MIPGKNLLVVALKTLGFELGFQGVRLDLGSIRIAENLLKSISLCFIFGSLSRNQFHLRCRSLLSSSIVDVVAIAKNFGNLCHVTRVFSACRYLKKRIHALLWVTVCVPQFWGVLCVG